jgi:hypothetical protein
MDLVILGKLADDEELKRHMQIGEYYTTQAIANEVFNGNKVAAKRAIEALVEKKVIKAHRYGWQKCQ